MTIKSTSINLFRFEKETIKVRGQSRPEAHEGHFFSLEFEGQRHYPFDLTIFCEDHSSYLNLLSQLLEGIKALQNEASSQVKEPAL